jgi:hypothetical protein
MKTTDVSKLADLLSGQTITNSDVENGELTLGNGATLTVEANDDGELEWEYDDGQEDAEDDDLT